MQLILRIVVLFMLPFASQAQMKDPVHWTFSAKKISKDTYEVHATATLEKGWHIYSQTTPEGGPVATTFEFAKNPLVDIVGTPKEVGKLEQKHEPIFGVDVKQYSNSVDFVQTIKLKKQVKTNLTCEIEYMSCNDHECLPPTGKRFSVQIQ